MRDKLGVVEKEFERFRLSGHLNVPLVTRMLFEVCSGLVQNEELRRQGASLVLHEGHIDRLFEAFDAFISDRNEENLAALSAAIEGLREKGGGVHREG